MFTNLYVALCGAALTAATYALFGMPMRIDAVVGLVFCCTLVIYNLDRLVEPRPGDTEHERWVERHRRGLWWLTGLASLGAGVLASTLEPRTLLSLLPAGAVALGYGLPVLYWAGRWHRLKALPGAKLALIAGVWAYATAGLPMIEGGLALGVQSAAVLVARLLFIAAVALPFDLPDMQRDRQSGIATLPTRFGVEATRRTAFALTVLAMLAALLNPWPAAAAVQVSLLCNLALIAALRPDRGVVYFMVLLDGMLLVQAGALWLVAG